MKDPTRRAIVALAIASSLASTLVSAGTTTTPRRVTSARATPPTPRLGFQDGADLRGGDGRGGRIVGPSSSSSSARAARTPFLPSVRGGGSSDYDDYDEEEDDFFSDDDGGSLFDLDEDDFDSIEDDFAEETSIDRFLSSWSKTPPLTKAWLTASFVATAIGYASNKKHEFPSTFLLEWKPTLRKLQLWRPITAFLNFGPFGIGYVMTIHFVWTYMSTLERLNHAKPYEFWSMILFGCATMVAGYTVLGISPKFLGHNLSTFLVYVWSRYHEGLEVNMFELFNTRAELLPWFFLAQTFLLEGEFPILDLLGIAFGHVYHHCKTTNVLRTPKFVIDWYNGDSELSRWIRSKYETISSDFEMP